jgi:hypothetical protein
MGLWNLVVGVYRIEDVGGIELLAQACAGEDRAEMLAEETTTRQCRYTWTSEN